MLHDGQQHFQISGEMVETNVCIEVWTPSKICKNLDLPIFPIFKRIEVVNFLSISPPILTHDAFMVKFKFSNVF